MFKNLSIKIKLLLLLVFAIVSYGLMGGVFFYSYQSVADSVGEINSANRELYQSSFLNDLAFYIRYYDEALTQAARNYAFTGDKKWRDKYYGLIPGLDEKISQAIAGGNEQERKIFEKINQANILLVEMEEEAIRKVEKGERTDAVEILESERYWQKKNTYQAGLEEYAGSVKEKYGQDAFFVAAILENNIKNIQADTKVYRLILILAFIFIIIYAFLVHVLITRWITIPLGKITKVTKDIIKGDFDRQVDIGSRDEFGQLAGSFNKMVDELNKTRKGVEDKVRQRTAQLEKVNKIMVDRELKMIELKKELARNKKNQ